jgi:hypothetical protein
VSPATGSLHAAPPFPPAGSRRARFPRSQRYYEGATTSHPRICGHLWIRFRSPSDPSYFRVRRSDPLKVGGPFQARALGVPAARISGFFVWTRMGSLKVSRRSFPCLCCAPRPRSNRRVLGISATSMLPPLCAQRRLRQLHFGAPSRSFGTRCPTLRVSCCHSRARLASGWLARLCREGVEPSGPLREVSARIDGHPPLLSS